MSNRQATADLVKQLLGQLQSELSLSQQLGGTPEGQEHLARAHQLKAQLMQIQHQFAARQKEGNQRQQGQNQAAGGNINASKQGKDGSVPPNGLMGNMPNNLQQQQQMRVAQMQDRQQMSQFGGMDAGAVNQVNNALNGQPRTTNINAANGYQQRFNQVEELRRHHAQVTARIEQHEQALRTRTNPNEISRLQQQLEALKQRRELIRRRESVLMRDLRQALAMGNNGQNQTSQAAGAVSSVNATAQPGSIPQQQQQPSATVPANTSTPPNQRTIAQLQSQMLRGIPRNAQGQPVPANQIQAARLRQLQQLQQQMRLRRQGSAANGQGDSAADSGSAGTGAPNLYNSTVMIPPTNRPLGETMAIPSQLNVQPITPSSGRPGRPTLTNGGANDSQSLNTPGLVRPPHVDMSGDRLLSKRKLSDLVSNIIGEDQEPLIDGDVEELLLDLADEFVANVTQFACKLAKHRKSDILEAKDIHMHLERNWNMHIAGYSSDEIRSIRRFLPAQAYQQKMQGILMAKSVQK